MNNEDRIRLAEAMGFEWQSTVDQPMNPRGQWLSPFTGWTERLPNKEALPFDPFTDANDDYAVLEWMRPDDWINSVPIKGPEHQAWRDFIFELRLNQRKGGRTTSEIGEGYQIGDYARAALAVIDE